ncbi:MAG: mannitol dehydrogenase family protein [Succiniclasticum sp.]|nr:mannitol dehydrogenase family protein [Succiniclasticum sp.]MEE3479519.1 mannitol dehydrogenase family protein [Succiniclasticum sp.]
MKLLEKNLPNPFWKEHGIAVPSFDHAAMMEETYRHPRWVHFGPGNIFRAFIAALQQRLLDKGLVSYGITAVETNFADLIEKVYKKHDNLNMLMTMNPDQSVDETVIGSVGEALASDPKTADWQRLRTIFRDPGLAIVSFTVTEKGYQLHKPDGSYADAALQDLEGGPASPSTFIGKLSALLLERFQAGSLPVTLLSLDNCSHNGAVVQASVREMTRYWEKKGFVPAAFPAYLEKHVTCPWSMIDKITPRPSPAIQAVLEKQGLEDMGIIRNDHGGFFAPFVNAEKTEYLVVEDTFANGRPPLEEAGVIFTDRATVEKVERMKVCTCLNPLHTALAVYGCLLGYTLIADEMKDPELAGLVRHIGQEGMKVVTDPGVLSPQAFLQQCLEVRFPNPAIPDTPQRIACDTSQKVGIRYGETIKAYGKEAGQLRFIPLAIAGWCRYLLGVDDTGKRFELSPDPLLDQLRSQLSGVQLGEPADVHAALQGILSNTAIFGSNLYNTGLAETVEAYFRELMAGPGAVRATLKKYVTKEN